MKLKGKVMHRKLQRSKYCVDIVTIFVYAIASISCVHYVTLCVYMPPICESLNILIPIYLGFVCAPFRNDRKVKETQMLLEEEKSSAQRLQDQVNQLNTKLRNVRREKEDAEGEAEGLQKKLRQARSQLEEAEDNYTTLQAQINKLRAAARKPKVQ